MGGARRVLILVAAALPVVLFLVYSAPGPAKSTNQTGSAPAHVAGGADAGTTLPVGGPQYPPGFADTLVAPVPSPTALAFTPDGRMLVASQTGKLLIHAGADGRLLPEPALGLSAKVCSWTEQGLLGIAVHPLFPSNGYVYLFYTLDRTPGVATDAGGCVHRVSRWTMHGDRVDPASELVLLDNIPSPGGNHNGGYLHFGKDGYLYVSIGDGGCDYAGGGCAGDNDASRDRNVLQGKILRITDTGDIPAGNPFLSPGASGGQGGPGSGRCNLTGRTEPGMHCAETFAWGLRNPFRLAFDPDAATTRFYVNDVGQDQWEEIDEGRAGADYGWNTREGNCANGSTTDCGPPPATMTGPVFNYHHEDGCTAIAGGTFVPRGAWPPPYDGAYLFADFMCGSIFRLVAEDTGGFHSEPFATGLGGGAGVDMTFGPSAPGEVAEAGRALYYTTYANGGEVHRIDFTGGDQRRPRP